MKTSMSRRQDIQSNQLAQYERMLEIREFEEQINTKEMGVHSHMRVVYKHICMHTHIHI